MRNSARARHLLIVGNGPTGVSDDGLFHVDLTCGHFLLDLAEAGYDVSFLQGVEPISRALNYYGCVLRDEVSIIGLDRRTPTAAATTALAALKAWFRADFVHLFFPGRLPSRIAALCRAFRKPYGLYVRGEKFGTDGADARSLSEAAFVLVASEHLASRVRPFNANVELIRPMCELSTGDALLRDPSTRRAGPMRLLFVGRIEEDKGVPELIEATQILLQREVDVELRLVGLGNLHADLAARFAGHEAISVLGAVEDRHALMEMYEQADIFVMPSHHEGFPRVLYEAMLKSAAVVSTMVGGIPGLLRDEENCLAIPVGDAGAIAEAVQRLERDRSLMHVLGSAGRATALGVLENNVPHAQALMAKLQ